MAAPDAMTPDGLALTAELLALRGQPIVLTPHTAVPKPGGGYDYTTSTPRAPQRFAMFNDKGFDGRENSTTDQGLSRKFSFHLDGAPTATIEVGDQWEDSTARYVVETVDRTLPYIIRATVTGFLKETGHGFG